ncbi:MAG: hypothetical protein ACYTHM_23420, partial [Planctomycetota bacterium]
REEVFQILQEAVARKEVVSKSIDKVVYRNGNIEVWTGKPPSPDGGGGEIVTFALNRGKWEIISVKKRRS